MATVIDQIRGNSPDLAELLLAEEVEAYCGGGSNVEELLDAFRSNTVIEYLRLDRDFLPSLPEDACPGLFQAIGRLPALKEAHVKHAAIRVKVLSDFLSSATGLEHLTLGCLALDGTSGDFDLVTQSLKGHPNLQTFCMSDFSLHDNDIVLDGFIETLSTIPNLQTVKLEVSHARRRSIVGSEAAAREVCVSISGKALANLARRAPKLRELVLNRLNLSHADFVALAEAIGVAPSLQVLGMPRCQIDDHAVIALAHAVGQSKTLQRIDMSCNKITDEGCVTLASGLEGNASVTFLRLWGNAKISNEGFDAVREMLEQNCVLERVPLMAPAGFGPKIDADKVERKHAQAHAA